MLQEANYIEVRQDSTLYLDFAATLTGSLNSIEFVDNADDCNAMLNILLKWSIDDGKTWSEPCSVYDASTTLNDFILAYAEKNESVVVSFIAIVDITWRKQWTDAANITHDAYKLSDILVNGVQVDEVTYADEALAPTKVAEVVHESNAHLWNPYANMQNAIVLQDSIIDAVNKQLGHVVIWFSHEVSEEHRVASLRAYDLIHTGAVKWLKLLVVDNNFNTNKVTYDAFDIDFEQGITAHIPKVEYERVFGVTKQPQQFDYCYVPVANRMLEVTSVQQPDGIMLSSPYYEVMLKTYEHRPEYRDATTMNVDDSVKEYLDVDALTQTFDTLDADKIDAEQVESMALNMLVTDTHIDLSLYETNRRFAHKAINVVTEALTIQYVPVSSAYYDMSKVGNDIAVEYVKHLDADMSFSACCYVKLNNDRKTLGASWQIMRLGRLLLVVVSNKFKILDTLTGDVLNELDAPLSYSNFTAVSISYKILDNKTIELQLCSAAVMQLNDTLMLAKPTTATSILANFTNSDNVVQLYGFNGYITHIRVDLDACRSFNALLMQQQPFESTIIADDAQQIFKGTTALLVGDASMFAKSSKSSDAVLKSDAYVKFDASHIWLCSHNNYKHSVNVLSNTLWSAK